MKIAVVGIGFVGLPLAAAFAEMGNSVYCLDQDLKKIAGLKQGKIPINEPGLDDLVEKGLKSKSLIFTNDWEKILKSAEIIFIAVGTPPGADGSADMQYVESVAEQIGRRMTKPLIVVDKSTVPVGTAEKVTKIIQGELQKRKIEIDFEVVSNPEFMAEGRAVKDMMEPNRIILGTNQDWVAEKIHQLYKPFMMREERFFQMGVREAELTKYASNAALAMKISYINTIAAVCDFLEADVSQIALGMGSDSRIGNSFLHASCGYGGSCFPKDVKALIHSFAKMGIPKPYVNFLKAIEAVNDYQKTIVARKIVGRFGENLRGKKFALWGLSFKANTNDMRESAAVVIVDELLQRGAKIVAYDPLAIKEAKTVYLAGRKNIIYEEKDKYKALDGADALIIATETAEYRSPDFDRLRNDLKNPIIFDGRNLFDLELMKEKEFEYYGIGHGRKIDYPKNKF